MSEKRTDNTEPTVKRADALQVGDHVIREPFGGPRRPARVALVHPFTDGDGIRMVSLVLDTMTGGEPVYERTRARVPFEMADEQDLAEARAASRRQQLLDDLVALRHVLDAAGVRLSTYQANPVYVSVVEGEVDRLADVLGVEARPFGEGGNFAVEWTAPGGSDLGDRLTVKLYGRRAPQPEPLPEAEPEPESEQEWLFTFGSGQQFDGRFVRIFGSFEDARERMCRVFGTAWCDQYDWRRFDELGLMALLTELPEAEWPTPEPQDGHVYSCCGKTGRISPHMSGCPAYKAMVADERPAEA